MGRIKCVVKSCQSTGRKKKKGASVSFYQPRTIRRLENWKKCLGIELKATDNICHLHFKEEHIRMYEKLNINGEVMIMHYKTKMLKEDAVPTIHHQFFPTHELQHTSETESNQNQSEDEECQVQKIHIEKQKLLILESSNNTMDYDEETEKDLEEPSSLHVHNDLKNHQETEVVTESFETIIDNMRQSTLPQFWLYSDNPNGLDFMRMDQESKLIKHHIRINGDLSITIIFSNNEEMPMKKKINSFDDIYDFLTHVERWPLCVGIQVDDLQYYSTFCEGVIVGDDTKISEQSPRCEYCRALRTKLRKHNEFKKLCTGHCYQMACSESSEETSD